VDVGEVTNYTLKDINPGRWYFCVTSYQNTGPMTIVSTKERESIYSDEIMMIITIQKPEDSPKPPQDLKGKINK